MSAQDSLAFNIRKWEAKNLPAFLYVQGSGCNWVEIKMPSDFIYGGYIHLRDLLFLYGNVYDIIHFEFLETMGSKRNITRINDFLVNTPHGKAVFIDKTIRPVFNKRYYYRITDLPMIPEEYGLYHKFHYRVITKEEMERGKTEYTDFYLRRMMDQKPYFDFLSEPVIPKPICKYVCYVCKRMHDLKNLYTFRLDNKNHHICHQCYDEIPYSTMEQVALKKV